MPQTIETTVYQLDELSDEAKERAREWWREGGLDYEWFDAVYEDAKECGKRMGITVDQIYFSGFWSQGDGACFEGSYEYAKGAAKEIRKHAPEDTELHKIADALQDVQRKHFFRLSANVKHRGHYQHAYCTEIDVYEDGSWHVADDTCEAVKEALRDFMNWIYRRLEAEWEWLNSDEQVDETIRANAYTFTEEGKRF